MKRKLNKTKKGFATLEYVIIASILFTSFMGIGLGLKKNVSQASINNNISQEQSVNNVHDLKGETDLTK